MKKTRKPFGKRDNAAWEKTIGPPQPFKQPQSNIVNRKSLDAHPLLREYFAWRLSEPTALAAGLNVDTESAKPEASAFGSQGSAFHAAQLRLYEHLCASVPYWPEGRDGLLPLYQAVAHGCQAGRFEEACDGVYRDRILRGTAGSHAFYSSSKLGLLGLDLAAVACFFVEPWSRLAHELTPADQAWLLSEAAFRLRALNRLAEAREPMRASIDLAEQADDWQQASIRAGNLSELELTLGDVHAAESTAAQAVTFADRSKEAFERMVNRTTHADSLHHAGKLDDSLTLFAEAEALQAKRQPGYPLLYSTPGYKYCDLLLAPAERAASAVSLQRRKAFETTSKVTDTSFPRRRETRTADQLDFRPRGKDEDCHSNQSQEFNSDTNLTPQLTEDLTDIEHRATQALEWATNVFMFGPLDIALDHLTLGRVLLLRAVLDSPVQQLPLARTALDTALATLRQSNNSDDMPRALLPSAWLHALAGEWDMSVQRLNEAFALATRGGNPDADWQGGMRLHLIDTLLHRVRLFGRQEGEGRREKAKIRRQKAKKRHPIPGLNELPSRTSPKPPTSSRSPATTAATKNSPTCRPCSVSNHQVLTADSRR